MSVPDDHPQDRPVTRRRLLAAGGVAVGSTVGIAGTATAQTTGERPPSPSDGSPSGEAQIRRRAIVPRVGQPFRGEYVGQFLLFTDPTPHEDVSPSIVGECAFAEWPPEETRGYQGLLVDRLTDQPRGVEVPVYLNQNKPPIELGDAYIVGRIESCSDHFIGVELESVPVERFRPEYGTIEHPLVGESPGPAVSPLPNQGEEDDGGVLSPGQPGFGLLAGAVGVGVGALLRWLSLDS